MQQFDLCRVRSASNTLAVILQHDWLIKQKTVVVAPAIPTEHYLPVVKLHPKFEHEGKSYIVALDLVMTIPRTSLGITIASLASQRDMIKRGLDTLFDGF